MPDETINNIVSGLNNFKAVYTLYGEKSIERYELTDMDGNKVSINSLNGYQKGVVLNDCMAYFEGSKYLYSEDSPWGVIRIEETKF